MSRQPVSCMNDQQLQQLLSANETGDLEDAGDREIDGRALDLLSSHLDHCDSCSRRLESMAADDEFWDWSASSLWEDEQQTRGDESGVDFQSQLSPVLQTLLGPTEQPESLGRIGRFEILGVVGHGGMGTVLKARDVDIDRIVALKLPAAHLLNSPQALERVEREARSAATIRHPGIIEIYQVERWRGIPYLVMPFHTGPSLMARLRDHGPMQLLEAIRIARQTAEALAAAHRQGVVHRDVKPGNILLGKGTERAVLTDFGIAKLGSDSTMTASGVIVGTPAFLSPEQAKGQDVTAQSDLFSLGTVLWSMLAGEPPFLDLPTHTVVASIANGKLPSLRESRRDLPAWVFRLIECLHQVDPLRRLESAEHCAEVLRQCEQHLIQPRHRLPSVLLGVRSRKWQRRALLLATAVTAAMMIPVATGFFAPQQQNPESVRPADQKRMGVQPAGDVGNAMNLPSGKQAGSAIAASVNADANQQMGMAPESIATTGDETPTRVESETGSEAIGPIDGNPVGGKPVGGNPVDGKPVDGKPQHTLKPLHQVDQTLDDLELELQEVMAELNSMLEENESIRSED